MPPRADPCARASRSPLDRADAPGSHSTPTRLVEISTVSCIKITWYRTFPAPTLDAVTRRHRTCVLRSCGRVNSRLKLARAYLPISLSHHLLIFHTPPLIMNDGRDAVFNRGVLHAEANANTHSMNNATSPVPHKPMPSAKTQNTQSPQPLSLQIDGLNPVTLAHGEGNPNPAYIESSERGSDTSGDGRRLDLSASTLTDSLSSLPSSSTNDNSQSTEFGNSHTLNGHTSIPWVGRELLESQLAPHMQPVNGGASIDRWEPSLSPIKAGNVSISPPPSPKHSRTRSNFDARLAPSQKRTAAGDFKSTLDSPTAHSADAHGAARRRSKSTGSSAYGSRIAQVTLLTRSLKSL